MASIEPICGHNDRVRLKDVLPLKTPFTLNIFPTNACNFKCHYCAQVLGKKKLASEFNYNSSELMSISTFEKIIEQSKNFPQPYKLLSFMGHGEPLINKLLPKMIEMANYNNIAERIEIITNGSLLSHDLSDKLIDAGVSNIRVSIQGLNSNKYSLVAGVKVNFNQLIKNLEYFHKKGKKFNSHLFIKIMDCSLDLDEEKKFYELFDNISTRMYIEQVKPVYAGVNIDGEQHNFLKTDRYGNTHAPRIVCPLPFFSMAVWPNGDIAPCDAIYKPALLGNISETTLAQAFSNKTINLFRQEHLNGNKNTLNGCAKCCAPDDVSNEMDELDSARKQLSALYSNFK
ncbi:radical SAM/SPASM domain-containing protein [Magnetovirga frankeli]|uniref:radical SAM/SPASM domain-containing protein n=1 Tax=Magnetovirga frankeli TaxID=947516 RepID=UPI003D349C8E